MSASQNGTAEDRGQESVPADEVEIVETGQQAEAEASADSAQDPAQALAQALEDLQETSQRADASHQSYLRAMADLDNYRKRTQREQEAIVSRTTGRVLTSLLPVLDSFDAALGQQGYSEEESQVLSGMKATYDLLLGTLQNLGLEMVPTAGHPFSPDLHQPVNAPPDGEGEIMVSDEVRRGYRLGGQLLRAALVVVTRRNESE